MRKRNVERTARAVPRVLSAMDTEHFSWAKGRAATRVHLVHEGETRHVEELAQGDWGELMLR